MSASVRSGCRIKARGRWFAHLMFRALLGLGWHLQELPRRSRGTSPPSQPSSIASFATLVIAAIGLGQFHTSPSQLGEIASRPKPKLLVLYHAVPRSLS